MTMVRSRYLLIDDRDYYSADGQKIKLAYSTSATRLFSLPSDTAERLLSGSPLDVLPDTEVQALAAAGAVVSADHDELAAVLGAYRAGSDDPAARSFAFMPTSYCNMACGYCGQEHVRGAADRSAAEDFKDRVLAAFADPACRKVIVGWFGGEPLMGYRTIRELSAAFCQAARDHGKGYSARMPTNGSLLTVRRIQELHDDCRLTWMDVTLDGPEAMHDKRRIRRSGKPTYLRIVDVLSQAVRDNVAPNMTIGIRVNVDAENAGYVSDLIADLACFGLGIKQVELHLMPVHSWGNDISQAEIEHRVFAENEIEWFKEAHALGINFPGMPTAPKRSTCRATTRSSDLTDATGRTYSCSEHPLVPGARDDGVIARIEELTSSVRRPRGMFDDWYDRIESGGQQCASCPMLPICGGACPKQWIEGNVPCPSIKHNWRGRLGIIAADAGLRPAV